MNGQIELSILILCAGPEGDDVLVFLVVEIRDKRYRWAGMEVWSDVSYKKTMWSFHNQTHD